MLGDVEQFLNKTKLAFDFCRFCVVIRFFHPRHNGQWYLTCHVIHATSVASCCQYVLHASPSGVWLGYKFPIQTANDDKALIDL